MRLCSFSLNIWPSEIVLHSQPLKYVLLMETVCNMQSFQVLLIFCHLFFVDVYN